MDDVPQGVVGAEMVGSNASRSEVSGGAATTPRSSGAMSPGSPSPFLPGSTNCASLSINWRRVEGEAQLAC
jgi:hypothetical protein